MQGIGRPKWQSNGERATWGIPPTYAEWLQIQERGKTDLPAKETSPAEAFNQEVAESGHDKEK
jgi:hypothetical protein